MLPLLSTLEKLDEAADYQCESVYSIELGNSLLAVLRLLINNGE
jgi:hypothetical protein